MSFRFFHNELIPLFPGILWYSKSFWNILHETFLGSSSSETGSWQKVPNIYFSSQHWDGRPAGSKNRKSPSTLNFVFTKRFNGFKVSLKFIHSPPGPVWRHLYTDKFSWLWKHYTWKIALFPFPDRINDYNNNKRWWGQHAFHWNILFSLSWQELLY